MAPNGYKIAADTTFTIDETGKVTTKGAKTTDEDGNTVLLIEDAPINATPALEKYINKDVHQDLPAFDTPFTYDILAFVTDDAESVVITDKLAPGISFLDGASTKVTVQDIGTDNDHTAHGTVEQAAGTEVESTCEIDGKNLTVNIPDAKKQGLRGHWVRVTYEVVMDNTVVSDIPHYSENKDTVDDNNTVISEDYANGHEGVATNAEYVVKAENGKTYELAANDITVTPPTETVKVEKKWKDANGKSIAWPEGAEVTIQLTCNGEKVAGKTIELTADKTSGAFEELPIYESITYGVEETEVSGVSTGFTTVTAGSVGEGFKVTNTLKSSEKDNKTSGDSETKKSTSTTSGTSGGTTRTGTTGSSSTSSGKLAKTGDPMADVSALMLLVSGLGSALVGGGTLLRRRKRDEEK